MKLWRREEILKTMVMGSVFLLPFLIVSTGCGFMGFKEWEWRQKVTVEVETPTGLVSESSVMAVKCGTTPKWVPGAGAGGFGCSVRGEGVPVEIAPGKVLFALLKAGPGSYSYPKTVAFHVFFPKKGMKPKEEVEKLVQGIPGVRTIPANEYPLFVTFSDITDPATVKKVDPDNLTDIFGPGVSLRALTLEISDEAVTDGKMEQVLGWYWDYRKNGYRLNGKKCVACPVSSENLADMIGTGAFKIGGRQ